MLILAAGTQLLAVEAAVAHVPHAIHHELHPRVAAHAAARRTAVAGFTGRTARKAGRPARSAYVFTMFKAQDMPDELFESQYESLRREFDNIRDHFAAA